ncbi:MAG: transcription antitermination factor NusB [Microvirga sp.]|nr:transcription antitermination factor NusB [Microvirga sp.]
MSKATERSAARLAAVQAIYQMDLAGKGVVDVTAEFESYWIGREIDGVAFNDSDVAFFRDILAGVVREQRAIDAKVDGALAAGWPLKRIETVLRGILRAGAFELLFRRDVPPKVTINEYVEIAHSFYSEDEPGLVNGVLDAIARETRADELGERGKTRG